MAAQTLKKLTNDDQIAHNINLVVIAIIVHIIKIQNY